MKKYSLSAMVAAGLLAGGLTATSASAADLGGNCCADLEERIAELEATTARKGNRKVSLTISGWVAEQVTWWDDGHEQNTYVGGIGTTLGTNVKFTGQATISPGWSAGYVIHLEADGSDTLAGTNQFVPDGPGLFAGNPNYVQTLQSFWFMKSDHLGKASVGLQSMAADNAAILVDGSGSLVVANWVGFNTEGFFMRRTDANAANFGYTGNIWAQAGGCNNGGDCYGIPINGVRYDTPTYWGFSGSAGWGEDDYWDTALRYAGEFWGWKVAAAAAYAESTCAQTGPFTGANSPDWMTRLSAAARSRSTSATPTTSRLASISSTCRGASGPWATTATSSRRGRLRRRESGLPRPGMSRPVFVSAGIRSATP